MKVNEKSLKSKQSKKSVKVNVDAVYARAYVCELYHDQ